MEDDFYETQKKQDFLQEEIIKKDYDKTTFIILPYLKKKMVMI